MKDTLIKKIIFGTFLFLGYMLFTASWKIGDLFILNNKFSTSNLATSTAILTLFKLAVNFSLSFLIAKVAAKKLFNYATKGFACGIIILGLGMASLLITNGNFILILISRSIVGIGGALILLCQSPVTSSYFTGKDLKIMNGFNFSASGVGITLAVTFSTVICKNMESSLKILSIITLIIGVLLFYFSFIYEGSKGEGDNGEVVEDNFSIFDGLKNKFNWIFLLTFSSSIVFYTISFTFIEPRNVIMFLYAGVIGNIFGMMLCNKFDIFKVARITTLIAAVSGIPFVLTGNQYASIFVGFFLFSSLPSFVMIPYMQKGATRKSLTITFVMLFVLNDLSVILYIKLYAFLKTNTLSGGETLLIALISAYSLGTLFISKYYNINKNIEPSQV